MTKYITPTPKLLLWAYRARQITPAEYSRAMTALLVRYGVKSA